MAENTTEYKEIIDVEIKNGGKTIKELRKQIKELKDEIQNLTLNGKDATEQQKKLAVANNELATATAALNKVFVEQIEETDTAQMSYEEITKELKQLTKASHQAKDAIGRARFTDRINELNNALKAIDAEQGKMQRNVGNYPEIVTTQTENLRITIRKLREDLERLDESSVEYKETQVKLAEAQRKFKDIQEESSFASRDFGDRIATITQLGKNLASGFSAAQGMMALFGSESENVGKVLVKLNAVMAIVAGLDGIDGIIKNIKGLTTSFAPAIQAVRTFITGLTGMKAALVSTGIGALAVALGTIAANWNKITTALGGGAVNQAIEGTKQQGKDYYTKLLEQLEKEDLDAEILRKALVSNEQSRNINDDILGVMIENTKRREELANQVNEARRAYQAEYSSLLQEWLRGGGAEESFEHLVQRGTLEGTNIKLPQGFSQNAFNSIYKLQKEVTKTQDAFNGFLADVYNASREWQNQGGSGTLFLMYDEDSVNKRFAALKESWDEIKKLNDEWEKERNLFLFEPEMLKKIDDKYEKLINEVLEKRKKASEEDNKIDEESYAKKIELQSKVEARFNKGLLYELEERKKQYDEEMALFSGNKQMQLKLTTEYYEDTKAIRDKYIQEDLQKTVEYWENKFKVQKEALAGKYNEQLLATGEFNVSGQEVTQMEVKSPTELNDETVLQYSAELSAAQALYEYEIEAQNEVIRNQIQMLENWKQEALLMKDYATAAELNNQINGLNAQISENENKVAENRVETSKKMTAAQQALTKESQNAISKLEFTLQLGRNISSIFGSMASMMDRSSEEGLAAYKTLATASAVIDTIASAVATYKSLASIPVVGPVLGAAGAAAAVAAGMANVMQIQSTELGSTSVTDEYNSTSSAIANVPDVSTWEPQYTRNIQTNSELEQSQQPIYVTVTDINKAQQRQAKVVDSTRF